MSECFSFNCAFVLISYRLGISVPCLECIKLDNVNMRMGDYGFCYLLRPVLFNNIVTVHPRDPVTPRFHKAIVSRIECTFLFQVKAWQNLELDITISLPIANAIY